MQVKLALKVHDSDNVATIFADDVADSSKVEIRDKSGSSEIVTVKGKIPYGHKLAVKNIAAGERIVKYGEEIGAATKDIVKGEYVHVHNLESLRGRGDLREVEGV